jgi:hypothetical protein
VTLKKYLDELIVDMNEKTFQNNMEVEMAICV